MPTKRFKDLTGTVFGSLEVVGFSGYNKYGGAVWLCKCKCGAESFKRNHSLISGRAKTCGCSRNGLPIGDPKRMHGMSNTKFYKVWKEMHDRVYNKNRSRHKDYGGRGIKVCERWHLFQNFYDDAFESYRDGLTIDRYPDNNGDYSPDNFRWTTILNQNRNRRNSVWLEYDGVNQPLTVWAKQVGLPYTTLLKRYKNKWEIKEALYCPPNHANRKSKV